MMMMNSVTKRHSLMQFTDRVALIVTDLNGFQSSIVNEEISEADFGGDLNELFDRLRALERTVSELGDVFWR